MVICKTIIQCYINLKIQFSADENLDDSDREALVANHLSFSRMTNTTEVLLRLFSRGVISGPLKEQLVRKTNIEGIDRIMFIQ